MRKFDDVQGIRFHNNDPEKYWSLLHARLDNNKTVLSINAVLYHISKRPSK